MKLGRVCGKHNQWCPDGECPYCPTRPVETVQPVTVSMPPLQQQQISGWIVPAYSFHTMATIASYIVSNGVWQLAPGVTGYSVYHS